MEGWTNQKCCQYKQKYFLIMFVVQRCWNGGVSIFDIILPSLVVLTVAVAIYAASCQHRSVAETGLQMEHRVTLALVILLKVVQIGRKTDDQTNSKTKNIARLQQAALTVGCHSHRSCSLHSTLGKRQPILSFFNSKKFNTKIKSII